MFSGGRFHSRRTGIVSEIPAALLRNSWVSNYVRTEMDENMLFCSCTARNNSEQSPRLFLGAPVHASLTTEATKAPTFRNLGMGFERCGKRTCHGNGRDHALSGFSLVGVQGLGQGFRETWDGDVGAYGFSPEPATSLRRNCSLCMQRL